MKKIEINIYYVNMGNLIVVRYNGLFLNWNL